MDHFDPSEYLAVAMEEQNSTYTGLYWPQDGTMLPDVPPSAPAPMVEFPNMPITMEGGLQMEQNLHIAAPTFGLLSEVNGEEVLENGNEDDEHSANGMPIFKGLPSDYLSVVTDNLKDSSPVPSPADSSSSPLIKRVIQTSTNESRFRKDFFNADYEKVKLFRLHCTICDKHLGCAPWITERQMRQHKMLAVPVCRACYDFYGDIKFPVEDGSEIYCFWCGQGGNLFCCSTCPKALCKDCVRRNFGSKEIKNIETNDDWSCMVCKPEKIWPHRAILWGLQRYSKESRVRVATFPKEEKQIQLSKDSSHCCPHKSQGSNFLPVKLAPKKLMQTIPMVLIASIYHKSVLEQPDPPPAPSLYNAFNISSSFNNKNVATFRPTTPTQTQRPAMGAGPRPFSRLQSGWPRPSGALPPNHVHRSSAPNVASRHARPTTPRPHPFARGPFFRPIRPTAPMPSRLPALPQPTEVIDLEDDTPQTSNTSKTSHTTQTSLLLQKTLTPQTCHTPEKTQIPEHDISWLAKSITDIKETLTPLHMMLDQFKLSNVDLKTDFAKLTNYSERLSYNIKIAICSLAKINQDIADNKKMALDSQVSSVLSTIQKSITTELLVPSSQPVRTIQQPTITTAVVSTATPERPKETEAQERSPDPKASNDVPIPGPSPGDDDVPFALNPALLCETVMEVEGNKENKISNSPLKNLPTKNSVLNKKQSMPMFRKAVAKKMFPAAKRSTSDIQVIDLSDEESNDKFDSAFYCKKFNIKPCKVVVTRSDTKKD